MTDSVVADFAVSNRAWSAFHTGVGKEAEVANFTEIVSGIIAFGAVAGDTISYAAFVSRCENESWSAFVADQGSAIHSYP